MLLFFLTKREKSFHCSSFNFYNEYRYIFLNIYSIHIRFWTETKKKKRRGNCNPSQIPAFREVFFTQMPSRWRHHTMISCFPSRRSFCLSATSHFRCCFELSVVKFVCYGESKRTYSIVVFRINTCW